MLYTINSTWFCGQATTCCDSNTVHWQLLPQLLPRLIFPNFSPRFSLSSTLSLVPRQHLVLRKETRIKATPTFHFKERAWNCHPRSNSAGANKKDIPRAGMHSTAQVINCGLIAFTGSKTMLSCFIENLLLCFSLVRTFLKAWPGCLL